VRVGGCACVGVGFGCACVGECVCVVWVCGVEMVRCVCQQALCEGY